MDAGSDAYTKIISDPFDGTIMPITYIPDWSKIENQDKSRRFEDIPISDYIPIPQYDALSLSETNNSSKTSMIMHFTYITPYMWSYRLNYKENDWSHLAIDIRSPIGTPVLSIANGVVVRSVEADSTWNRFVVIRHDNVPIEWKNTSIYSSYLHLSEINVTEWAKIRKWEMLGRVGNSWLATTPHLHFQIDTADAPFHPYWPFTSSDSRKAWLSFFESIDVWLWKDWAKKYTIHPMNFVNMYLWWIEKVLPIIQETNATRWDSISQNKSVIDDFIIEPKGWNTSVIIAENISESNYEWCKWRRFPDINEQSSLWKMLYPLMDERCLFQYDKGFIGKSTLTMRDALIMLMNFYKIEPASGTSHFLDVEIWDILQWYSLVAYRRWIIDGNYLEPEKILTKEDFIDLLVRIGKFEKNPSQIKIYQDVDSMNPKYSLIQDYAYKIHARWGKFSPKILITKSSAIQILSQLTKYES
jgi:Peptidase family M23